MSGSKHPLSPRTPFRTLTDGFARRSNPSVAGSTTFYASATPFSPQDTSQNSTVAGVADIRATEEEHYSAGIARPRYRRVPSSQWGSVGRSQPPSIPDSDSTVPPPYNGSSQSPNPVLFSCNISHGGEHEANANHDLTWIPVGAVPAEFVGDNSPCMRFQGWLGDHERQSSSPGTAEIKVSSYAFKQMAMRTRFFLEWPKEGGFEEVLEGRLLHEDDLRIAASFLVKCNEHGTEWLVSFLQRDMMRR